MDNTPELDVQRGEDSGPATPSSTSEEILPMDITLEWDVQRGEDGGPATPSSASEEILIMENIQEWDVQWGEDDGSPATPAPTSEETLIVENIQDGDGQRGEDGDRLADSPAAQSLNCGPAAPVSTSDEPLTMDDTQEERDGQRGEDGDPPVADGPAAPAPAPTSEEDLDKTFASLITTVATFTRSSGELKQRLDEMTGAFAQLQSMWDASQECLRVLKNHQDAIEFVQLATAQTILYVKKDEYAAGKRYMTSEDIITVMNLICAGDQAALEEYDVKHVDWMYDSNIS